MAKERRLSNLPRVGAIRNTVQERKVTSGRDAVVQGPGRDRAMRSRNLGRNPDTLLRNLSLMSLGYSRVLRRRAETVLAKYFDVTLEPGGTDWVDRSEWGRWHLSFT